MTPVQKNLTSNWHSEVKLYLYAKSVGGVHEGKIPNFRKGNFLEKVSRSCCSDFFRRCTEPWDFPPSGQTALQARAQTEPWRRWIGRFYTILLIPEPAWRIIYPLIITTHSVLNRAITTNSLIPVTTPLATPVAGDVAGSLYPTLPGQSIICPGQ